MAKLELTEILHKQERRLGTVEMKVEDPNAPVALAWEHDKTAKRCHCSSSDPKDNLPEDREVHRNVQNKCKPPKGYLEALGSTNNTEKQTHHAEVSAASTDCARQMTGTASTQCLGNKATKGDTSY